MLAVAKGPILENCLGLEVRCAPICTLVTDLIMIIFYALLSQSLLSGLFTVDISFYALAAGFVT